MFAEILQYSKIYNKEGVQRTCRILDIEIYKSVFQRLKIYIGYLHILGRILITINTIYETIIF